MPAQGRLCVKRLENGRTCGATALLDSDFCFWHSPAHEEEAQDARRLGGLRRKRERAVAGAYEFQGLTTVADIRRLLEVAALDTLSLENSVARARTLAYLAQTALKCLEVGDIEARLLTLEATLRNRTPDQTPAFDLEIDIDEDCPKELNP